MIFSQDLIMQDLQGGMLIGTAIVKVIDNKILAITMSQSFEIAFGALLIIIRFGVESKVDKYPNKANKIKGVNTESIALLATLPILFKFLLFSSSYTCATLV